MATQTDAVTAALLSSIAASEKHARPYPHWFMSHCLPADIAD